MSDEQQQQPVETAEMPTTPALFSKQQPPAMPQLTGNIPPQPMLQQVQVVIPQNMGVAGRPLGKIRDTSSVIILGIVTLGIYNIIWLYGSFESVRNHRQQGWGGGQYLLFSLVPFLNIVSIVIPWLLPSYIGEMYREDGRQKPITGLAGFWIFIPLVGSFIWIAQVNSKLNDFWRSKGVAA